MFQETADFSYAEFRDGSKFKDTVFKTSPCFHEAVIESNTTLPKAEDLPDRYSPNASNNYRFLRQLAQVKLDDSEVQKFRALELESRLNTHHDKGENVLSACYKAINNYGLNLWRPLYLLIALFAVSLELYTLIELQHPTHEVLAGCPEALAGKPICPALGNALKSILGIFTFVIKGDVSIWPENAVHFVTIILSSILWFFFIFGIRRRFKI